MNKLRKILLSLLLSLLLTVSLLTPAFAAGHAVSLTPVDPAALSVARLGQEPLPDEAGPERDPNERVRVSVFLTAPAARDRGFALDGVGVNAAALTYRQSLQRTQADLTSRIAAVTGHTPDVRWNLTLLVNAVSMVVPYGDLDAIRALPGVKSVEPETQYRPDETEPAAPDMTDARDMVGANGPHASAYTGAGAKLAVIDTGLDIEHQSFDEAAFLHAIDEDLANGTPVELLTERQVELLKTGLNAKNGVYLSAKIPFAYNYVDNNTDVTHTAPGDYEGEHGSHVAGIAAANRYLPKDGGFVSAADTVGVVGQAPDAQVFVMKVFGVGCGAYDADYFAAVEDAVALGAASANLSLGSGVAGFTVSTSYQKVLDSLEGTDFVLSCSMGNNTSWDYAKQLYADDVNLMTGGSPGSFNNSFTVASVYDSGLTGRVSPLKNTVSYEMSGFSAWGVPGALVLKPEITAPGGSVKSLNGYHRTILSTFAGGHEAYEYMSGTSMAAPQITGLVAALAGHYEAAAVREKTGMTLRQYAQGALMSTAVPIVEAESGSYYSLLKQGAGLADLDAAVSAASVIRMDEAASRSAADGKVKAELGDDPDRTGTYTYAFSVQNLSDTDIEYTVRTDVFTQALSADKTRMEHTVTPLSATVTAVWEGEEAPALSADVNRDGMTDLSDVEAILSHASGLPGDHDLAAADRDGDGSVTTRDAYLLEAALTEALAESATGTVPAGETRTVTVSIRLTDAERETLNAERAGGAYLEAFTFIESDADVTYSIPVLGFYGSWTDASMFDAVRYTDAIYGSEKTSYFGATETNGWRVTPAGGKTQWFTGNPYEAEAAFPAEKLALRSDTALAGARFNLIRAASGGAIALLDESGKVVYTATPGADLNAAFYNTQSRTPGWVNTAVSIANLDRTPASFGLSAGQRFTFGYFAFPEYYAFHLNGTNRDGSYTKATFTRLLESGRYGKGASIGYTVMLDDTAPTLGEPTVNADGTVTLRFTDNAYVAVLRLLTVDGKTALLSVVPENEPGEEATFTFDPAAYGLTNAVTVFVGDYAGNETAALVRFAPGEVVAETAVFALTNELVPGARYVIAPVNAAGTTHALALGYRTAGRAPVIVNAADAPYILASGVPETAVWTLDDDLTLQNGGQYLSVNAADGSIRFVSSPENALVWTYENNALSGKTAAASYFLRYENNAYALGAASMPVYLYREAVRSEVVAPASAAAPARVTALSADDGEPAAPAPVPAAETLTLEIPAGETAENALLDVSFDPAAVSFVSAAPQGRAVINAEPGRVRIALTALPAVPAGETLVTLTFTGGCLDEHAALLTAELNASLGMTGTEDLTIPGAGHDWGQPSWTWTGDDETGYTAAVAAFTCRRDPAHTAEATAAVTVTETPATSASEGETRYTATATGPDGRTYTDEKRVAIPRLAPDWALVGFTWTQAHTAAAAFVDHNNNDAETVLPAAVTAVTTPATSVAPGQVVYTATVTGPDGATYTDEQTEVLPQLDPAWEMTGFVWTETGAEAVFVDHHNNDAETRVPAAVTAEETAATCEADGLRTETATATGPDGETYTDARVTVLPATGHAYEAEWSWSADNAAASVTLTCAHDASHTLTLTAAVTRTETAPTCTAAGEILFTAVSTGPDGETYRDEKSLPVAALGHDRDENGVCRRCGDGKTPSDNPDEPGANPSGGAVCKYCGEVHERTLSGSWTRLIHSILLIVRFLTNLFGGN